MWACCQSVSISLPVHHYMVHVWACVKWMQMTTGQRRHTNISSIRLLSYRQNYPHGHTGCLSTSTTERHEMCSIQHDLQKASVSHNLLSQFDTTLIPSLNHHCSTLFRTKSGTAQAALTLGCWTSLCCIRTWFRMASFLSITVSWVSPGPESIITINCTFPLGRYTNSALSNILKPF